jgi:type II restriction enzyme
MLSGNKGEWSEIYVFLKLLATGRLNAADENLDAIANAYYPIIKILREQNNSSYEFHIDSAIKLIDANSKEEVLAIPISEFVEQSEILFKSLKKASGRSFSFPEVNEFLDKVKVSSLAANSRDKSDINIVVHDLNTGLKPKLGFSIKSMLGKNSTLFNAGNTTNFIYELRTDQKIDINLINSIEEQPKILNRLKALKVKPSFSHIQSSTLELNLRLIDSDLPEILAEMLVLKYSTSGLSLFNKTIQLLKESNPLNFDMSQNHPFYEYKLKNFLTDSALGMTPATKWEGKYDATGGIIVVKQDGDIVCYHIYNRNEFQKYLVNNTRFEQASTSRYNFGSVYEEDGRYFIKLNLQIRFTN